MSNSEQGYYWYWICNITGVGILKIRKLLNIFNTPENVYKCSEQVLRQTGILKEKDIQLIIESKKDSSIYQEFIRLKDKNISFISYESKKYPQRLKNIYDAPIGLFSKGNLIKNDKPSIAIVGARKCTEYGRQVAYSFGKSFANMGIQVVSGMANGIDTAAQKGCIDGGGSTYAVLGCGVDVCYPANNIELYNNIQKKGGILSEYQVGAVPMAWQFPVRNRIISGLADVVIIVEAGEKSGSLITADLALEQNNDIMVVPGRIGDVLSIGCNRLIKQGAQMITQPEDVLDNYLIKNLQNKIISMQNVHKSPVKQAMSDNNNHTLNNKNEKKQLASQKDMLYSCFDLYPKSVDTILKETSLDIMKVNQLIAELLLEGDIKEVSKNCYVRVDVEDLFNG